MNELTIGPGDEASLSIGTLMGDMEGEGGHLPGTLREGVQKILEMGISHFRDPLGNLWSC